MNQAASQVYPTFERVLSPCLITQDEAKKMSKYRVIQKNLVHVQGFPDSILNYLDTFEFFGQFGRIIKLVIVKGKEEDSSSHVKKSNSAYITFSSNEEAAHAVLAVDSFYYESHLIRAFFGTSKYCIHFLNNKECYNKDKCMYLHYLASETDVLGNTCGLYSKFDYTEHLQIAISISGVLNKAKREVIAKAEIPFTVLPNIKSIYSKDIVLQAERKFREIALPTFTLLSVNANASVNGTGKGSGRSSTNDGDASSKSSGKCSDNCDQEPPLFHYRSQSRFATETNSKYDTDYSIIVPFYLIELIDKALSRYASLNKPPSSSMNEGDLERDRDAILYASWSDVVNSNNK